MIKNVKIYLNILEILLYFDVAFLLPVSIDGIKYVCFLNKGYFTYMGMMAYITITSLCTQNGIAELING